MLAELACDNPANIEHRDHVNVEGEAWAGRRALGDIPMTVISNDYGDAFGNEEQRTNVQDQQGWLVLSPQGRQVVVTSGHDVPENEPALVVEEILGMVDAARSG